MVETFGIIVHSGLCMLNECTKLQNPRRMHFLGPGVDSDSSEGGYFTQTVSENSNSQTSRTSSFNGKKWSLSIHHVVEYNVHAMDRVYCMQLKKRTCY